MAEFGSPSPPPSVDQDRIAEALRQLTRWAVTATDVDGARWARAADALEALVGAVGATAPPNASRYPAGAGLAPGERGATANPRGTHPLFGTAHPSSPPVRLVEVAEGGATVEVTFDARFEGLRGCVHGGFIATGFDIACGMAVASSTAGGGPTGTLTVRYRALTPIGERLRYTSRVVGVEGRKVFVEARLATTADERTTAEAEAVFVQRRA
jgi:acyl-coenzyme A thioesterase PaaI-like protein